MVFALPETIIGAVIMGLIIGLIELFFVHADEAGMGWLGHGIHALPTAMLFVFIAMHVDLVFGLIGQAALQTQTTEIVVRSLIGLVAALKVKSAAAIAGRVGENWPHAIIIGALIAVSPYIWKYIGPIIMGFLPIAKA